MSVKITVLTSNFGIIYISVGCWSCCQSTILVSNIPMSVRTDISSNRPCYIPYKCRCLMMWVPANIGLKCHLPILICPLTPFFPDTSMWLLLSGHITEGHPGTIVSWNIYVQHCLKRATITEGLFYNSVRWSGYLTQHLHCTLAGNWHCKSHRWETRTIATQAHLTLVDVLAWRQHSTRRVVVPTTLAVLPGSATE
jgi:hypothetical protein